MSCMYCTDYGCRFKIDPVTGVAVVEHIMISTLTLSLYVLLLFVKFLNVVQLFTTAIVNTSSITNFNTITKRK